MQNRTLAPCAFPGALTEISMRRRNQIFRHEALRIVLQGNAEFYAENVTITGDRFIEVPDGCRLVVTEEAGELKFDRQTIRRPTWQWNYSFNHEGRILLEHESV